MRKLDYAERWFRDGMAVCHRPAFFQTIEVDVSHAAALIEHARTRGLRLTYATLLVRAVALVLKSQPALNVMVCGNKMHYPLRIDIALSIAGEGLITPVLIIEGADQKMLATIADEIVRRVPEVQKVDQKLQSALRRWGWVLPWGFLRRALLRFLHRFFKFRRAGSGTFQVSMVQGIDSVATPLFNTCAILTAGQVKERVIVVDGQAAVRPTLHLTCAADHGVWHGKACSIFLLAMREMLETNRLWGDLSAEMGANGGKVPLAPLWMD